jgi:transposase
MGNKVGTKYTTPETCRTVRNLAANGVIQPVIAAFVGCSERTVRNILARYEERGHDENAIKSGAPWKLTEYSLRYLARDLNAHPRQTLGEITETINNGLRPHHMSVSAKTMQRSIHRDLGMACRCAHKKPFITETHIAVQKLWADVVREWSMEQWKKIIWTDEMSFEVGKDARITRVWRPPGCEYDQKYLVPTFKSGRTSLMVWGAMAHGIRGPLIKMPKGRRTAKDYIAVVLGGALEKFYLAVKAVRGAAYIVEDGAPVHTAKLSQKWREAHAIKTFPHPACSPDLNPIEHIWSHLKDHVNNRVVRPKNVLEVEVALFEEWEKVDMDFINSLVESMPCRVEAVLKAHGNSTRY